MTDKPNIEALSREFCELAGIEFVEHWWCPKCQEEVSPARVTFDEKCDTCMGHVERKEMPDFSDAREVLKVMRARCKNDYEFSSFLFSLKCPGTYAICLKSFIDLIEDDTGLMLKEAVEWLRKEKR